MICHCPSDYNYIRIDKLAVHIMLYGSEMWRCKYREEIGRVQRTDCKMLFGLTSSTPNYVVLREVARLPLNSMNIVKCIKVGLKFLWVEHCYIKTSSDVLKRLDDAENIPGLVK